MMLNYSFEKSARGPVLIATSPKGVVYLAFYDSKTKGLTDLKKRFPRATLKAKKDRVQGNVLKRLAGKKASVPLLLSGTDFQMKVWNALQKIPAGSLTTYGKIAQSIGTPRAVRAVGTAVGANPIAILVPCHRVLPTSGKVGNYRWGSARKHHLIQMESKK